MKPRPVAVYLDFKEAELACVQADLKIRLHSEYGYSYASNERFTIQRIAFESLSDVHTGNRTLKRKDYEYDPNPDTFPSYHEKLEIPNQPLYKFLTACYSRFDEVKDLYCEFWKHQVRAVEENNEYVKKHGVGYGWAIVKLEDTGFDPASLSDFNPLNS